MVAYAAFALGAVPLVALGVMHRAGRPRDAGWWGIAGAFAVSFLADLASLVVGHPLVSQVYPVTQAALIAAVLLPSRPLVESVIALFLCAAAGSIVVRQAAGLDVLLHTIAWGGIALIAYDQLPKGALRSALVYGFGLGVVAWWAFVAVPGWWTWGAFQLTRVFAVGGFTLAAWRAR